MSTGLNKQRLKQILSARQASVAIIFIAIIGRLMQIFYFFNVRVDASYQTIATKNFLAGHGISIDFVLPSDLSTILYEPLIRWPPGFSLLLAPFYFLSGGNYIGAGIILHGLCAIALIFYSRAILKLFEVPQQLVNVSTIVTGFFIYPFYLVISSDAISTSFFIAGFYYTMAFFKTQNHSARKIFTAAFCFIVCAWTKYLLIPVVFLIPNYLIISGLFLKDKRLKQYGLIMFLTLIFGAGYLLAYQKFISGSAAYINTAQRGFFPENLIDAYLLFPGALLSSDTLTLVLAKRSFQNFIVYAYRLVYLLSIALAAIISFRVCKKTSESLSLRQHYFLLVSFISAALIGFLAILSSNIAKGEETPGVLWTFIQEPRYYGPLIVLIQLSLFIFYPTKKRKLKFVFFFLFFLLAIETCRGIIFDLNRLHLFQKEEYSWQYENRFQKYADNILRTADKTFGTQQSIVTGSSYYLNNRVCLFSHVPILPNAPDINQFASLQCKKPVLLLVIINKKDFPAFQSFLAAQKETAGKFDDYYFYTVYIQAHS